MKKNSQLVSIVIPAFNEELFIGLLLEKIINLDLSKTPFSCEVVVVNDGSTDNTEKVVKKFSDVKLITQNNSGKGCAVQNGIKHSVGNYVIVQDADLEYDPNDILEMLKQVHNSEMCLVYGSRILGGKNVLNPNRVLVGKVPNQSFFTWLFNRILSLIYMILYFKWISDSLTGYKLYPREFLDRLDVKTRGFETDHELTCKALKQRLQIFEVPVAYKPRTKLEGKKISIFDAAKAVLTIIRFRILN